MNGRVVWAIAWKDIVDAIKNRYLLISLIMPVGLSLMFHYLFGGSKLTGPLMVAVYDPGGSRLTAQLQTLPQYKIKIVESQERLKEEVRGEAVAGVQIPEGFDSDVDAGKKPELTVFLNAGKGSGVLDVVQTMLERQIWAMRGESSPANIVWEQISAESSLPSKAAFQMDFYLLIMFLLMSLTITGDLVVPLLLVEEKEKHTMEFLLVSPVNANEVVAGKALTGLVYSGIGTAVLMLLNRGLSGNWPVTILALTLGVFFMIGVGLLVGCVLNTTMQINTWSSIIMMVFLVPGMLTFLQLSGVLGTVVRLIPTSYLVDLLNLSLTGQASPTNIILDLVVLLGSTVAAFGAVIWLLRRQTP